MPFLCSGCKLKLLCSRSNHGSGNRSHDFLGCFVLGGMLGFLHSFLGDGFLGRRMCAECGSLGNHGSSNSNRSESKGNEQGNSGHDIFHSVNLQLGYIG